MLLRPLFLSGLLMAFLAPAAARELGSAPVLRILGFSPDGRHFGFVQEGGDGVSGRGAYAIDVVLRDGGSAPGFPRGATQLAWDAEPADARRTAPARLSLRRGA